MAQAWTCRRLVDSSAQLAPWRRNPSASGSIRMDSIVLYRKQRCALFQLEHFGVTVQALHQVNIFFSGLHILDFDPEDRRNFFPLRDKDGDAWVMKPDFGRSPVLVRCSCLGRGTRVLMGDYTEKNIEDVRVGDAVVTHLGRVRKVIAIANKKHEGKVYRNKYKGYGDPLISSDDHEFFVVRGNEECLCGCGHRIRMFCDKAGEPRSGSKKMQLNFSYKQGHAARVHRGGVVPLEDFRGGRTVWRSDLNRGDMLTMPKLEMGESIKFSEDKASILGYYAAEGYVSLSRVAPVKTVRLRWDGRVFQYVQWAFHWDERETLVSDLVDKIFRVYGVVAEVKEKRVRDGRKWLTVESKCQELMMDCVLYVGRGSRSKRLADEVFEWSKGAKIAFLSSYLMGDGNVSKGGRVVLDTSSRDLHVQCSSILFHLGIRHSRYRDYVAGTGKGKCDTYRILVNANLYPEVVGWVRDRLRGSALKWNGFSNSSYVKEEFGKHFTYILTEREEIPSYQDVLFDLTVEEDESFIANGVAVHNCPDSYFSFGDRQRE